MRRGERAPADIPLENKQNKTGFSGQVFSRFIKFTYFFFSFPFVTFMQLFPEKKNNPKYYTKASLPVNYLCPHVSKAWVGSAFNAISRLSVVKWRCLLSSCHRIVWHGGRDGFLRGWRGWDEQMQHPRLLLHRACSVQIYDLPQLKQQLPSRTNQHSIK